MSLDVMSVFEDGIDAFLSKKALVLAGIFVVFGVLGSIAADTFGLAVIDGALATVREQSETVSPDAVARLERQREQLDWALQVDVGPAVGLLVASFLLGELVRIGAVRALADNATENLQREHYTRNLASIFLNRVVVALVSFVLLGVTAIATLLVPGVIFPPLAALGLVPFLYVAIGLFFASYAVTIDEVDALEGLSRAWTFAKGNRLRLVLIAVAVGVVQLVVGVPTFLVVNVDATTVGLSETLQRTPGVLVVTAIVGVVNTVFRLAIATQTYVHLAGKDDRPMTPSKGETDQFTADTEF